MKNIWRASCIAAAMWLVLALPAQQIDYNTQIKNKPKSSVSITFKDPTVLDTGKVQYEFAQAATLLRIACSTDQGNVSINFDVRSEASPNTPGTSILSNDLVCVPSSTSTITFITDSIPAQAPLNLQVNGASGTPGVVRIWLYYKL